MPRKGWRKAAGCNAIQINLSSLSLPGPNCGALYTPVATAAGQKQLLEWLGQEQAAREQLLKWLKREQIEHLLNAIVRERSFREYEKKNKTTLGLWAPVRTCCIPAGLKMQPLHRHEYC